MNSLFIVGAHPSISCEIKTVLMALDRDLVRLQEIVYRNHTRCIWYAVMEFVPLVESVRQRFHGI
jgi:hypothetical protein